MEKKHVEESEYAHSKLFPAPTLDAFHERTQASTISSGLSSSALSGGIGITSAAQERRVSYNTILEAISTLDDIKEAHQSAKEKEREFAEGIKAIALEDRLAGKKSRAPFVILSCLKEAIEEKDALYERLRETERTFEDAKAEWRDVIVRNRELEKENKALQIVADSHLNDLRALWAKTELLEREKQETRKMSSEETLKLRRDRVRMLRDTDALKLRIDNMKTEREQLL